MRGESPTASSLSDDDATLEAAWDSAHGNDAARAAPQGGAAAPLTMCVEDLDEPLPYDNGNLELDYMAEELKLPPCQVRYHMHGRLRKCADAWVGIGASREALGMVREGAHITFKNGKYPPSMGTSYSAATGLTRSRRNHGGAAANAAWTRRAIDEMIKFGVALKVAKAPWIVAPIDVIPKPDGIRYRLIYDARDLNEYTEKIKFVYESLAKSRSLFNVGDWLFCIDFESGYFHVDMYRPRGDGAAC